MSNLTDTTAAGRYDIIIFPNGGKECIKHVPSMPYTPESAYLKDIVRFVSEHQGLEAPTRFTGYYSVKDGVCTMQWYDYAGDVNAVQSEQPTGSE